MTEEQWKKRNEMVKEIEEKRRQLYYVRDGYFITLDVYKNFLKEHGYILTAYDGGGNIDWDCKYMNFFEFHEGFEHHLTGNMILIGNPEEWGKYVRNGYWCNNMVNNPFVKYLKTNFTTFKIFTIIENEDAKGFTLGPRDECLYCAKLEKDLSKEWLKYLVKICPEFATYQIEECERKNKEAQEDFIRKKGNLVERLAKILEEEKQLPIIRDNEIAKNNEIINMVKETQKELQQTI